jgi:hypothetical protein
MGKDLLPQIIRLGHFAGPRLGRRKELLPVAIALTLLALYSLLVLARAINQAVARGDEEEAA